MGHMGPFPLVYNFMEVKGGSESHDSHLGPYSSPGEPEVFSY